MFREKAAGESLSLQTAEGRPGAPGVKGVVSPGGRFPLQDQGHKSPAECRIFCGSQVGPW